MSTDALEEMANRDYEHGWSNEFETDTVPKGLNEDVIRMISAKKQEPEWLLEWRLDAYRKWLTMKPPTWARVEHPDIDFQDITYYSAPKSASDGPKDLSEVDPEILEMYEKLGIGLD
ncbi:MAG: Fe-S cluster assembly protein SufB, partial [Thermoplasmatota archaeon]